MKQVIACVIVMLISSPLWSSAVGKITALSGEATLSRGTKNLIAALGSNLEIKDTISTAKNSKAQLTFKDNTIITVGKQTVFSVEEYLNDTSANSDAKFNVVTGTIRAMSGKIGKIAPDKFKVKTKTATIGIRGTDFIVQVLPTGELVVLCLQGTITVTPPNSNKTVVVPAGSFVTISAIEILPDGLSRTSSVSGVIPSSSSTRSLSGVDPTASSVTNSTDEVTSSVPFVTNSVNIVISEVREFTAIELNQILKEGLFLPALLALLDKNVIISSMDQVFEEMPSPEMMTLLTTPLSTIDPTLIATQTGMTLVTNTQATPSALPQHFTGYAVGGFVSDSAAFERLRTGAVDLVSDPTISSVNGYVRLYDINDQLYWRGDISSSQSPDYVGVDNFSVGFSSFTYEGDYAANKIAYPISSTATNYVTTVSDTSDDYFAFGFWQLNPMTVSPSGTPSPADYDAGGYWAAGVPTPTSVIDGFRSSASAITYSGNAMVGDIAVLDSTGTTVESFSRISSGSTQINVDFGNDTFQQNNTFSTLAGDAYVLDGIGNVNGNQITGTAINNFERNGTPISVSSGSIQGGFYGPTGKIVGGTVAAEGTSGANVIVLQSAFKATAP